VGYSQLNLRYHGAKSHTDSSVASSTSFKISLAALAFTPFLLGLQKLYAHAFPCCNTSSCSVSSLIRFSSARLAFRNFLTKSLPLNLMVRYF
jgi:hypothetical protein